MGSRFRQLLSPRRQSSDCAAAQLLERRLLELCDEMELRAQQQPLARLLALPEFRSGKFASSKSAWVALLTRAGMTEEAMHEWHRSFESDSPQEHANFLRSLGLKVAEVARIRR